MLKLIYLLSVFLLVYFLQQEQETSYTILRSKGTNVTLNGLKPDTTYLLQIRARTAAGYGGSSRKFEFETSPDCKHLLTSCHNVLYLPVTMPNSIHSQLCRTQNNTDNIVAILLISQLIHCLASHSHSKPHG